MSYLFELQTHGGVPAYVAAQAETQDEALEDIRGQLELDDDEEVIVLAVHTVH